MSGILSGPEIQRQIATGYISIDPYDRELINPASIDLRLGDQVCEYTRPNEAPFDCKVESATRVHKIGEEGIVLYPRELYLMHTLERVSTSHFVPVLDGKSSIGRLGICVHLTAGYGDPGFDGQYTLEVTTVYPVRVYAGMRFCQIRFHTIAGLVVSYQGNYVGEASMGPVPSRVWKQFK